MRAVLQTLLIFAVTFLYVVGPYVTVEMEHTHEVCEMHGHQHTGDHHDHHHSDHSHDGESIPSPGDPDSDAPEGDSHSHTHVVSLAMDASFVPATNGTFMANRMVGCYPAVVSEFVPDGPCFSLIKPPQLG